MFRQGVGFGNWPKHLKEKPLSHSAPFESAYNAIFNNHVEDNKKARKGHEGHEANKGERQNCRI